MRLVDHLYAARGEVIDLFGLITGLCTGIEQAQRFELADDVVAAGYNLLWSAKPTALLAVMPLTRLPYPRMWIEWRGGIWGKPATDARAPTPKKVGCLLEQTHDGIVSMTLAWLHTELDGERGNFPNVCPFSIVFDNRKEHDWSLINFVREDEQRLLAQVPAHPSGFRDFVADILSKMRQRIEGGITPDTLADMQRKAALARAGTPPEDLDRWDIHSNDPREVEAMHELLARAGPWISHYAWTFFQRVLFNAPNVTGDALVTLIKGWENDIKGEAPFVQCILAMLNSRNCLENQPVDLTKLNKARRRRGHPEFATYSVTHLKLSRGMTRLAQSHGMTREQARQHMVRGHFKIRKTGVFWWSPFLRGDAARPATRKNYVIG